MKYETNSKLVKEGQTFVAIKGHTVDGHDYIEDAIKNGATKVVGEYELGLKVPYEKVENSSLYLNNILKEEYSNELSDLKIIGVTGTNGKTTTCFLTYQLLNKLGKMAAYIGTNGFYVNNTSRDIDNTTPDILNLYKLLLEAKENSCEYVVLEVSSHALAMNRLNGISLVAGGFTNLTQDHLDYHETMEKYLDEKIKIVELLKDSSKFIINNDDEASKRFEKEYANCITVGYGADFKIVDYKSFDGKTELTFSYNDEKYNVITNLNSKFNVYNYLMSISMLISLGFDINDLLDLTKEIKPPKGRCETVKVKKGYAVVDYAHTPDAVLKVITAYNEIKNNSRVLTIVGCGGDRDPLKRPIMGEIASEYSDYVIYTSDNPRTEDPKLIMEDIINGVKKDNYKVVLDRKEAIKEGINLLEDGDYLLILGKGHEDYQIIGHDKIHLDDLEEVLKNV